MSYDDCPGCGVTDYGWEMPDVRSTLTINGCRCKPECVCTSEDRGEDYAEGECICEENGCDCDHSEVKVRVRRVFDRECGYCGGADYRCVFDVLLDGQTVRECKDEHEADAYIARVFPSAEAPEPDYAWESERWLRRAEGWGC